MLQRANRNVNISRVFRGVWEKKPASVSGKQASFSVYPGVVRCADEDVASFSNLSAPLFGMELRRILDSFLFCIKKKPI